MDYIDILYMIFSTRNTINPNELKIGQNPKTLEYYGYIIIDEIAGGYELNYLRENKDGELGPSITIQNNDLCDTSFGSKAWRFNVQVDGTMELLGLHKGFLTQIPQGSFGSIL